MERDKGGKAEAGGKKRGTVRGEGKEGRQREGECGQRKHHVILQYDTDKKGKGKCRKEGVGRRGTYCTSQHAATKPHGIALHVVCDNCHINRFRLQNKAMIKDHQRYWYLVRGR